MQHQKQLHQRAREDLWYMFTGEEIAQLCNVSQNVISRVKALADSPFFLNKCRPEWFVDWMRTHSGFRLTKTGVPNLASQVSHTRTGKRAKPSSSQPKTIRRRKPRSERRASRKS